MVSIWNEVVDMLREVDRTFVGWRKKALNNGAGMSVTSMKSMLKALLSYC
jgi:hypothetical protein